MKYPGFLKEGGTIGFVAPSFGCNIEPYRTAFSHAQDKFKESGYRLNWAQTVMRVPELESATRRNYVEKN